MARNNQNNLTCPFCGTSFYRSQLSFVSDRLYLKRLKNRLEIYPLGKNVAVNSKLRQKHPELIRLEMAACPNCHRITVRAVGIGGQYRNKRFNIYPQFNAVPLPNYVPAQIRKDYQESVEVVKFSPNSTAMLSRRILEEIISDFYHVQEGDLYHDLEELRNNEKNQRVWQAIDAIRRFGNLSVHTVHNVNRINANRNVSVKEAQQLTKLILVLIHDTYLQRYYRQKVEHKVIKSAAQMDYNPHYYSDESNQNSYSRGHRRHYRRRGSQRKASNRRSNTSKRYSKNRRRNSKRQTGRRSKKKSNQGKRRRYRRTKRNRQRRYRSRSHRRHVSSQLKSKSKGSHRSFRIVKTPRSRNK